MVTHPEMIFVDLEASSLDNGYPIEVGWAIVREFKVTTESMLIRPSNEWYFDNDRWSHESAAIHKITRSNLLDHGQCIGVVKTRLSTLFAGKTLYSDAHRYDFAWLVTLYHGDDPSGPAVPFKLEDLSKVYASNDTDEVKFECEVRKRKRYKPEHRAADDALNHALQWCHTRRDINARDFEYPALRFGWKYLLD